MQSQLSVGHARRVINPRTPMSLAGYFTLRMWDRILDDILVQSIAFSDGQAIAILVQLDLVTIPTEYRAAILNAVRDIPGLDPANVLFTASHTHTAPVVRGNRPGGDPAYEKWVVEQASAAIHESLENLNPMQGFWGTVHDDRWAFNRRYWMKDGTVVTNPPRRSPEIDRPEGPIDPEIGLLRFTDATGKGILLANICNHADTVDGCGVSADWHGFVRRTLEAKYPGLNVVTLTGCSGNLNHFDPAGPDEQSGYAVAKRIGTGYAERISVALPELQTLDTLPLRAHSITLTTPPREIPPEDIAEAKQIVGKYEFDTSRQLTSEDLATRSPAALRYFADALLAIAGDRAPKSFLIQGLKLGNTHIVTLPGEPFVEYGMRIKNDLRGGAPTLVATLSDSRATYIPNRFNYGRGGYETTPRCSPYSIDTGERMMEAVTSLLQGLD